MDKKKFVWRAFGIAAVVFITALFLLLPGPEERLLQAVWAGDTAKIKTLLEKSMDREDETYREAFRIAIGHNSPGDVQAFVDAGGERRDAWVLLKAADAGRPEIVRLLVEEGWEIDGADHDGETPLVMAASHTSEEHREVIRYLVENGADVNAVTEYGYTPLTAFMRAVDFTRQYDSEAVAEETKKDFKEIRSLLQRDPDRLLFDAVEQGSLDMAGQALEKGASLDTRDEYGNPPLVRAALLRDEPMIRFLVTRGADTDPEKLTKNKLTPLRALFMNKREEGILSMVRFLVEHGASIQWKGPLGESLLEPAVVHDLIPEMEYLIARGLDVNSPNEHGKTPLMTAALVDKTNALELLMESGADLDQRDTMGMNALFYAVEFGSLKALQALAAQGGDINSVIRGDKNFHEGQTLLMYAAAYGVSLNGELRALLRWLVEQGADLEAADAQGRTALILAIRHNREEAVRELLSLGADREKKDSEGHDAHFYAEEGGDPEILRLLQDTQGEKQ
ncbi:MAG TPA: ankyrin repeat domain-containing protein [Candidatus Mcinerneyibacteriales bacterium]|nr:ankyrin repeat domain-containing protein [Candidatus Mcinerneyibacteriales bacterium]